jgi:Family of unknown function (DUF6510)
VRYPLWLPHAAPFTLVPGGPRHLVLGSLGVTTERSHQPLPQGGRDEHRKQGFRRRRRDTGRQLPPGQYLTTDFPVLSAGPTPRIPLDAWEFTVTTIRVYGPDPGFVGRCLHCEGVLLRLVRTPDAVWLDFSGVAALRIPMPTDTAGETHQ